ncbi:MAG: endonuclease/exonuclease/phosphatase family protein, partial [Pseudomonadota bacterium]
ESMPRHMGNPITLLSRRPLADRDRILRRDTAGRAYITADLGGDWQGTRIVLAHAMTPLRHDGLMARNTLLRVAGEAAKDSGSFIMMGDFNLTPWAPQFRRLPGKRAGDPRGVATWPTSLRMVGLPIDHIMFDGDLELVDVRVLDPIGSDHLPVLATFRRR